MKYRFQVNKYKFTPDNKVEYEKIYGFVTKIYISPEFQTYFDVFSFVQHPEGQSVISVSVAPMMDIATRARQIMTEYRRFKSKDTDAV